MSAPTEQLHGIFIDVELDDGLVGDAALAAVLAEVCPVDIFAVVDDRATIVRENLDECVLCNLCVEAAEGAGFASGVRIIKLYE